jgi:hypothetical protein
MDIDLAIPVKKIDWFDDRNALLIDRGDPSDRSLLH